MSYGDRLRRARQDAGLTQRELAERIGVTPKSVSTWERGTSLPRPGHQMDLQATLGIEPELGTSGYETPAEGWGRTLRRARKGQGMTQRDVAEAVGVAENTISYWETSGNPPRLETRLQLCALLGISTELTDEEAVEAARDALLMVHREGTVAYDGPTASEILWAHARGEIRRWSRLCRRALSEARRVDSDVARSDSQEAA